MDDLEKEIKALIIEALDLEDITPNEIGSEELLFGDDIGLDSIDALELGIAIQKFYGIKLEENAEELRAVDETVRRFNITHLADQQLSELSEGQRQAVSIAQTLVSRPRVVLMDEPTSALDLNRQYEVLESLRLYAEETGAVMILALHDLNQVMRCCTSTIALGEGYTLASGPTLEVLTPDLIRRLYGIDSRVERCSRGCPMMIVDGPAVLNAI